MIDPPTPVWPELHEREVIHLARARLKVAALEGGAKGAGKTTLAFRIDLQGENQGKTVLAEVKLEDFLAAAEVLKGRFPR